MAPVMPKILCSDHIIKHDVGDGSNYFSGVLTLGSLRFLSGSQQQSMT